MNVVDFFCGCGGTSLGFQQAGMRVSLGIDVDPQAGQTYRANFPDAAFLLADVRELSVATLARHLPARPWLFSGCAPCQPFSKQKRPSTGRDARRPLLDEFGRFVEAYAPEYVFVENVPGLQRVASNGPLRRFLRVLEESGYRAQHAVVRASSFGVPQQRERLVLVAARKGYVPWPAITHGDGTTPMSTVGEWIRDLPRVKAGQAHPSDPAHRALALSPLNQRRIRATPEGGGRSSWPRELVLECHRRHGGHSDVYGRLAWDRPAAALTTRCISYSNGRFGHPSQHRALTPREAARLQTFPVDFAFTGSPTSMATQIGNAVPPLMARRFGEAILALR